MDMLFFLLVDFGIWRGVGVGRERCGLVFFFLLLHPSSPHTLCYLAVTRSLLANRCLVAVQDYKNLRIAATHIES